MAGLFLSAGFVGAEKLDVWVYAQRPDDAWLAHLICIIVILGIPAICMGATLPVFGLVARQFRTSIALLYSLNTLGAAIGVLVAAVHSDTAVRHYPYDLAHCSAQYERWDIDMDAECGREPVAAQRSPHASASPTFNPAHGTMDCFCDGLCHLCFGNRLVPRTSPRAFFSTTDAFAIMLSALLLSLGAAAISSPVFFATARRWGRAP